MFPNNPLFVQKLLQAKQEETPREIGDEDNPDFDVRIDMVFHMILGKRHACKRITCVVISNAIS
jgi:hypothetical protein